MPKDRGDSKLATLPMHQRDMLRGWLVEENLTYDAARERVRMDFGVETSNRALSVFFARECFADRFREAGEFADRVAAELAACPDKFDEATISLLKQKAFERAVARDGDLKELQILAGILGDTAKLRIKQQEVELAGRRVVLLEKKAEQADAAESITRDESLTPEQREKKMRSLFSIGG